MSIRFRGDYDVHLHTLAYGEEEITYFSRTATTDADNISDVVHPVAGKYTLTAAMNFPWETVITLGGNMVDVDPRLGAVAVALGKLHGVGAVVVEPLPENAILIRATAVINGVSDRVKVVSRLPVGKTTPVPKASYYPLQSDQNDDANSAYRFTTCIVPEETNFTLDIPTVPFEDLLQGHPEGVCLLKFSAPYYRDLILEYADLVRDRVRFISGDLPHGGHEDIMRELGFEMVYKTDDLYLVKNRRKV